jgi:CRP/FNR family cyclic AMP-dependent transcriptional regulator
MKPTSVDSAAHSPHNPLDPRIQLEKSMSQQLLKECDFFQNIPVEFLPQIASVAQSSSFSPGVTLFAEGHRHPHFHLITDGHIRLEMFVPSRGRLPILTAGPGDVIGWSALIGDSTMTSTAVALETVRTLAFAGEQLKQLCEADHEIGYHVMRQLATALSRRLLATRLQMLDLFKDTAGRSPSQITPAPQSDPEC